MKVQAEGVHGCVCSLSSASVELCTFSQIHQQKLVCVSHCWTVNMSLRCYLLDGKCNCIASIFIGNEKQSMLVIMAEKTNHRLNQISRFWILLWRGKSVWIKFTCVLNTHYNYKCYLFIRVLEFLLIIKIYIFTKTIHNN